MVTVTEEINSQNTKMIIEVGFVFIVCFFYLPVEFQFGDNSLVSLLIRE